MNWIEEQAENVDAEIEKTEIRARGHDLRIELNRLVVAAKAQHLLLVRQFPGLARCLDPFHTTMLRHLPLHVLVRKNIIKPHGAVLYTVWVLF